MTDEKKKVIYRYWQWGSLEEREFDLLEQALAEAQYHVDACQGAPVAILDEDGMVLLNKDEIYDGLLD